ncbi:MAG: MotA/TolQ/ExbB proton channel family protein [Saprospiraceae bacterium]|jgi:biopolymer transport protein ExbB
MRKLLLLLLVFGLAVTSGNLYAQDEQAGDQTEETIMEEGTEEGMGEAEGMMEEEAPAPVQSTTEVEPTADLTGYQVLKKYFIDGDWRFMSFVLVCLILGLAFCIERIITLNIATTNTDKLLSSVDESLKSGGVESAMEVCKATPGPTASIMYEGLKSSSEGAEAVEKSIVAYGSVQMGLLERGLVWISLFIAIAPMLGFMGTVIGMIQAFDRIEAVGDLSPSVVAGGIKVALLTTVFGLVTAIILQIFYNYIVNKIDGIVNKMEDASIALVDIMASNNLFK